MPRSRSIVASSSWIEGTCETAFSRTSRSGPEEEHRAHEREEYQ